jgi:eukaryotic-like serine/threonine-protein kinase
MKRPATGPQRDQWRKPDGIAVSLRCVVHPREMKDGKSGREKLGPYEVVRLLSDRSYQVLIVEDVAGEQFIVKRLPWSLAGNQVLRREFLHELEHLEAYDHPNLVRAFQVFDEDDSEPFAVMHCAAMNLDDRVGVGLTLEEGLAHLGDAAAALDFLHGKGLCHYDVKPENILIFASTRSGWEAKLNDFSLVRNIRHEPDFYGDVLYAAREIFELRDVPDELRVRSDVLSLAVTATTVLCGRPVPLAEREDLAALFWKRLPQATAGLLRSACSADLLKRPSSAGLLVSELAESLAHLSMQSILPLND